MQNLSNTTPLISKFSGSVSYVVSSMSKGAAGLFFSSSAPGRGDGGDREGKAYESGRGRRRREESKLGATRIRAHRWPGVRPRDEQRRPRRMGDGD